MSKLFSHFTKDSRRVLDNAKRYAKQHPHQIITPNHLLLGLLDLPGCQAETVLSDFPFKLEHLKSRLSAYLKLDAKSTAENDAPAHIGHTQGGLKLSPATTAIIQEAQAEAEENDVDFVDTRLLVLGMLRHPTNEAGHLLTQYGLTLDDFRAQAQIKEQPPVDTRPERFTALSGLRWVPLEISPVFWGIVAFTLISGYLSYAGIGNARRVAFLFITGGWIISLALHEFGHALVAFLGGDESIVYKGYLTLNPLRYTHPLLSIVLPIVFLILGGIPLPGGAVYVNRLAIRKAWMHSLVSAAGPIATALFGLLLALPFAFDGYIWLGGTPEFWVCIAFLVAIEFFVLFLNLLPLPGLDGFGIIEPFLAPGALAFANSFRPFAFLILLGLLWYTRLGQVLFEAAWWVMGFINEDLAWLSQYGFDLYRFWA